MDQQRPALGTSGRGFPFAPHASTLHSTNHSRGNTMHDHSHFFGSDTADLLPRKELAPFRRSTLFAEAAHVDRRVNQRYYEHLLLAIEDRAAALGLAFTRTPGAEPAQLSSEEAAALEQALIDAKHLWCSVLVPTRERYLNVGREVADGGGLHWLKWILDALAERDIVLMRDDAATAQTGAPRSKVVGP